MADEGVSLGPGLPRLPESLLLARDRGEVLFIVGAGASYPPPTNLPDFAGLVADIYQEVDVSMAKAIAQLRADASLDWSTVPVVLDDLQRTELKFLVEKEFDVVLGMLERRLDGTASTESRMRLAAKKVLSRTSDTNSLHDALVRLGQRFGRTLLATTNFDRLLSVAAKDAGLNADAYALGGMPAPSRRHEFSGILHIHGMLALGREGASQLILTDQDFGDAYLRRHLITDFLYDAARIFNLVLVGYSASDSPVRYLLNAIAGDERNFNDLKKRYAFIGHDPADKRIPVEWSARGITPISYDTTGGHKLLGDALLRWSTLTPEKKNQPTIDKAIRDAVSTDLGTPQGQEAGTLFKYLVRRASVIEATAIATTLQGLKAPGTWMSLLTRTLDEERGR